MRPVWPVILATLAAGLLWGVPLIAGLLFALTAAFDGAAWQAVFAHPQLAPALVLSVLTGTAALAISLICALTIVAGTYQSRSWIRLSRLTGVFLAIPHLAFAAGLGFLIMPSGWIARVIAQTVTGWSAPPGWVTSQDPHGIALITALVFKETPFLIWAVWSLLARGDMAAMLAGQWRTARSLGHGPGSIWLRLFVPQIIPAIAWPIVIVWVYGATVVDMALVIGPTQPPVYSVIAWADLNDAEAITNARGATGALLLALVLAAGALASLAVWGLAAAWFRRLATAGPVATTVSLHMPLARFLLLLLSLVYFLVVAVLLVISVGSHWPFPDLLPSAFHMRGWAMLFADPAPLLNSLWLGLLTSATAVGLAVFWFETMPQQRDKLVMAGAVTALAVPQITLVSGQYGLFLHLGMAGTAVALYLAHLTPVLAYVLVILRGTYRTFDPRYRAVSLGLNCSPWRFWHEIKRPLTMPALAAAGSVGFAVSMTQYLPAQLIGGGRIETLPIVAVTLASGGNRPLLAVFALALTLPPALGFMLAQRYGRSEEGFA